MSRFVSILLVLVPWAAARAELPPLRTGDAGQHVEVRRVVWPIHVEPLDPPGNPSICDGLLPGDVVVEEDGELAEVRQLERRPLPVVHALLLDTSNSMRKRGRLEMVKRAAVEYVRLLPPGEEVLVAAFDDSLTLISPPARNRQELEQSIVAIEHGSFTALWDAVLDLMRYLDSLAGQKVVILLSDGSDSSGLTRTDTRAILGIAANKEDLSVYPIGIDMASERDRGGGEVVTMMRELAAATGGVHHATRALSGLDEVFGRIRDHVERRIYAIYVPPGRPHGDPDLTSPRRVAVRARAGLPCRVVSAGPPFRRATPSPSTDRTARDASQAAVPIGLVDSLRQHVRLPESTRVIDSFHFRPADDRPVAEDSFSSLLVLDVPGVLPVRALDVVGERGVLYHPTAYHETGKYRTTLSPEMRVEARDVFVDVPDFDVVQGRLHDPLDVVLHVLRRSELADDRCLDQPTKSPSVVHGKTLLDIRRFVGLALFRHYPEYRQWARRRLRDESVPEIERLLAELRDDPGVDSSQLEQVERALRARLQNPDGGTPQRFLAEWLGDVRARDLALTLDAHLAGALLDTRQTVEQQRETMRIADSGWPVLLDLFPPATDIRVVSILVPAYAEDRDVFGFFRVVLPRPSFEARPVDLVPAAPLAFQLVRRLIAEDHPARRSCSRLRVVSTTQLPLSIDEQTSLMRHLHGTGFRDYSPAADGTVYRVRIRLAARGTGGPTLDLDAFFQGERAIPLVMSACPNGRSFGALAELMQSLPLDQAYVQLPCTASGDELTLNDRLPIPIRAATIPR